MQDVVDWFGQRGGSIVAYVATLVAMLVLFVVPKAIRRRLRLAVFFGVVGAAFDLVTRRLDERNVEHLYGLTRTISLVCAAIAIARVVYVVVVDVAIERLGRRPMNRLVRDVSGAAIHLAAAIIALQAADVSAVSLLATTTVLSAVVGLSAQETLGNLFAGIAIDLEKPIAVGDWLRLDKGDLTGRVVAASWRSVTIVTDDRAYFVIPNSVFSKTAFSNFSRPGGSTRRSLYFNIPFDVPPTQAQEALLAACKDCAEVLRDPPPSVLTWTYGDTGITYWLRFYIADFARRDPVQGEVGARVWYHLHRRKITPAVPIRQTYEHKVNQEAVVRAQTETLLDRRAAIDCVDFLKVLSEDAKQTLAREGHRRLYGPKETIIQQGDSGRSFFMIRRGRVGIVVDGKEIKQLGVGDFFGELALLTGSARRANVVALEETEVFEIDEHVFKEVLRGDPTVAEQISTIVAKRQTEMAEIEDRAPPSIHDAHKWGTEILDKIKDLFALD